MTCPDTALGSQARGRTGALKEQGQDGLERYVVAQCVRPGVQLALALLHMPALEDTADYVRRAITTCRRTGAGIGTVMLDREFFSTMSSRWGSWAWATHSLRQHPKWSMPLRMFSKAGAPAGIPEFRMTKSKNVMQNIP